MLSIAATAVGGGFGLSIWVPYLCLVPRDFFTTWYLQLSVVLMVIPVSFVVAMLSRVFGLLLWKSQTSKYSIWQRMLVALVLLEYAVFVGIIRATASGVATFQPPGGHGNVTLVADFTATLTQPSHRISWMFGKVLLVCLG